MKKQDAQLEPAGETTRDALSFLRTTYCEHVLQRAINFVSNYSFFSKHPLASSSLNLDIDILMQLALDATATDAGFDVDIDIEYGTFRKQHAEEKNKLPMRKQTPNEKKKHAANEVQPYNDLAHLHLITPVLSVLLRIPSVAASRADGHILYGMFKLVTAEERVAIEAKYFGKSVRAAFTHALTARYANYVIPDVGLCIGIWDVLKVGAQTLQAGCGRAVATVTYRMVIFAPFLGEAVWTTIGGASQDVLLLALPFFGAIQVPPKALPPNTVWDNKENVWVWKYSDDRIYYYDIANDSVARITHTEFSAVSKRFKPPPPPGIAKNIDTEERRTQPMLIHAALHDMGDDESQGLGNPEWWYADEVEEEEGGDESAANRDGEEEDVEMEVDEE